MTKILNFVAASESEFGWISPVCLVGHCKSDDESMTMAQQSNILSNFRQGKTNVMVATSVAEEGIDIPSCNLVVRMEPAQTVIKFVQARGRARYTRSHYVIMCCDALDDEEQVLKLVERESDMQKVLDDLDVSHVAENCWIRECSAKEPEPLLALDPRSHDHTHLAIGSEQTVHGPIEVNMDDLVQTQATVKQKFTDGKCLFETMVRLVQCPNELGRVPLMRVATGMFSLLGRRSPFEVDKQVWFSADNRRCFMWKVVAPLCNLCKLKVLHVNWTDEFDAKLGPCKMLGPQTRLQLRRCETR
ncbi:unnamed protein product [Durusdinium trenchii]|uniref:Uncharacterized protein n=2 Tax=Durusdinium trenchii TaxID=1381693 RepID=A0ABP0IA98_9DINO